MSNLGVDLLRSDTGHYMQWPTAGDAPTAPVRLAPAAPSANREGRTWIAARDTTQAWVAPDARTRVGVTLSLVNWLVLLLLMCTFLLAKTLPAGDSALTGGQATQSHAHRG